MGYGEILAQSVTGLLLFSALMFLLIFIGAVLAIAGALVWGGLFRQVRAGIRRDWRRVLVVLAVLAALIVLFVRAEAVGWGTAIVELIALVLILSLILGLVGFIRSRSSRTNHQPDASTSTQSVMSRGNQPTTTARKPPITALVRRRVQTLFAGRWWRWSITTVFLLTIAVVALTLVMDARLGAARVLHGEAWRSTFGGIPMTSMQALPATIVWSSGTPPSDLQLGDEHCLLYLGESNSITVLYDAGARRSIRLPSSDVIVLVRNEEPACGNPE